jgi:hypothetical protein
VSVSWYERSWATEPARRKARMAELREQGVTRPRAAQIMRAEAMQRERERDARDASRNPGYHERPFRARATDARREISSTRERFAGQMRRRFPGWTPPGRVQATPDRTRTRKGKTR